MRVFNADDFLRSVAYVEQTELGASRMVHKATLLIKTAFSVSSALVIDPAHAPLNPSFSISEA